MAIQDEELHFSVLYRGKTFELKGSANSRLGDVGKEIVDLTGVAPHTLRLMLPRRPPLQPMSEQHSATLLSESGITEGVKMRMMGVSVEEVAAVSQPTGRDRTRGFQEEEQVARQRSDYGKGVRSLPTSMYTFGDFRTLRLPGVELKPPPEAAMKIMHKLASDRGISAVMEKHRWRIGVMTEMAPIGYVGVSPKCILGFNKNRGEEVSLRLRTDDLKGFRKYESIKKTLLHELAHMVHDEHDENFHALDKQLNEEAVALDWTKSRGHTLSGVRFESEEDEVDAGGVGPVRGYKLGGSTSRANHVDARSAAVSAALRRLEANMNPRDDEGSSNSTVSSLPPSKAKRKPLGRSEPDPDEEEMQSMVVIADGTDKRKEPDPDEHRAASRCSSVSRDEPDPDESVNGRQEPDPDEAESSWKRAASRSQEPDPDEAANSLKRAASRSQEPDPDDAHTSIRNREPDPDEAHTPMRTREPDPHEAHTPMRTQEPDPDETHTPVKNQEPDPDEAVRTWGYILSKGQEPDPDETMTDAPNWTQGFQEPDPDEMAVQGGRGISDLASSKARTGEGRMLNTFRDCSCDASKPT